MWLHSGNKLILIKTEAKLTMRNNPYWKPVLTSTSWAVTWKISPEAEASLELSKSGDKELKRRGSHL